MVDQKRDYFRLEYPNEYRPALRLQDRQYQVVDVSEYGIKFIAHEPGSFVVGQQLDGEIVFHDQDVCICRGKVIRLGKRSVILQLTEPVPLHKIRSENIFLISQFPQKHD